MYSIMADVGFDLAYQIDLALNSLKSPWMSKNRTLLNIQSDSLFMYLPIVEDGQVTGHFTTLSKSCVNFCGGVFRTRVKNISFLFDFEKSRQKVPKSWFQGQLSMSKIIRSFLIFSHQNIILDLLLTFFDNFNFRSTLFSKMIPTCWQLVWNQWKSNRFLSKTLLPVDAYPWTPPLRLR